METDDVRDHDQMMTLDPDPGFDDRRPRVALVGRDDDRCRRHATMLEGAGYQVVCVSDAGAVLAEVSGLTPELIIAHIIDPTATGLGLCRMIRADAGMRDTPVIVITSTDDFYTREQIVRTGATAILVEPLRRTLLLRQVRRLIARAATRRPMRAMIA